ncbi:MAG TPA: hypothetical protein VMD30_09770, partial [Tepidisphaeraceae bacterium]|nr:hypothetical protein [Tepidisphaeraceae bacterium]
MTIIPDQNHGSGCQCFDCQVKHWTILEQSVGAKPVPYRAALPTVAVPVDRQSGYASESIRPAAWGQSARDAGWATQSASGAAYANDESAPPEGSELKKLHQLMRGRYLLASVLATLLATIGIFAGFKCGMLYYQSVCELRVLSQVPKVLYSVEDNASIDEIDPFVNAQMATLQSQRVLDLAMSDPQWQSLGRGTSPEARYKFAQALDVSSDKDMIVVKAIDSSPSAAMVSVNSLVNAYLKIYDEDNAQTEQWRSQALDDLQQKFSADLSATEQSIQDDAKPYGADGLAAQFESTLQAVDSLDERVQETQQDLAFQAQLAPPSAGGQSFTPEEIAEKDEYMAGLIKQRDALLHDLDLLGMKGYLRNNPQVISDNDDLTVVRRNINEEAVRYQAEMKNTGAESTLPGETGILSKELTDLQQQRDAARARLLTLSEQREKVQELQSDADETRHRLDEVSERIEELRVEENPRGRVVINSPGTLPIMPIKDTRLPFAAAGGAAGVSLGFALVLLLALTDGRLRTAEQTESQASKRPVLGLLPALPESLEECDELTLAAQGVHEIRILLQMLSRGQRQRAFTVTSPAPGAGKTSLSLALGMSFASTGQKTLLIDCDFHGRGLSRAIDRTWRPVLAKDLKEKGLASDEQIEEAIRRINGSECGLDEMLAEMGV